MGAEAQVMMDRTLVFTYGTLKRGFSNHGLIQEMIRSGDAAFVGVARTAGRLPLVCGPYRVPFLLNLPGAGERVRGELYAVSPRGIARMDDLEGTCRGHYERLPISVVLPRRRRRRSVGTGGEGDEEEEENGDDEVKEEAVAYYAHRSYAAELWRRSGQRGFEAYSEKEARGYVKRKDRPQDTTFLDQIRSFVGSPPQN
ncbi:putative gamma-glutamylcyclotransferase At3g02910 [Phoenix dactylifera]|uniref:Gamma-glutamylcyclotransferase family protein n=1 Tax=Phoenix dactylifera TaxID=42345 RepID=A0A8B7BVL4_PHODC|nr:putative gamma-glutamylcyclotransferase At3g02910 [Phoenix dactylifera]